MDDMKRRINLNDAMGYIIANNYEGHAIQVLAESLNKKAADAESESVRMSKTILAIEKINRLNENSKERREGIASLCELN